MRRINRVQRLARKEEKDIVKRIFLLSIVSIILIFVLVTVGITALGKFSDFLDVVFKDDKELVMEETNLLPPILDNISGSTNNESLKVTGFSAGSVKVMIYKNAQLSGEVNLEGGKFEYDLILTEGENEISAKSSKHDGIESDFSIPVVVKLDKTEPKLEVTNPVEGQSFFANSRITVEGKTEHDAQVFVNGFLANVGVEGKFDVNIPLVEGDNDIEVKALDEAGNTNIVKVRVNFRK